MLDKGVKALFVKTFLKGTAASRRIWKPVLSHVQETIAEPKEIGGPGPRLGLSLVKYGSRLLSQRHLGCSSRGKKTLSGGVASCLDGIAGARVRCAGHARCWAAIEPGGYASSGVRTRYITVRSRVRGRGGGVAYRETAWIVIDTRGTSGVYARGQRDARGMLGTAAVCSWPRRNG